MNPGLLTSLRKSCICNNTLAVIFDMIGLHHLLKVQTTPLSLKMKADIIEAVIGELNEGWKKIFIFFDIFKLK